MIFSTVPGRVELVLFSDIDLMSSKTTLQETLQMGKARDECFSWARLFKQGFDSVGNTTSYRLGNGGVLKRLYF